MAEQYTWDKAKQAGYEVDVVPLTRQTIADGNLLNSSVVEVFSSRDKYLEDTSKQIQSSAQSTYDTVHANSAKNWAISSISGFSAFKYSAILSTHQSFTIAGLPAAQGVLNLSGGNGVLFKTVDNTVLFTLDDRLTHSYFLYADENTNAAYKPINSNDEDMKKPEYYGNNVFLGVSNKISNTSPTTTFRSILFDRSVNDKSSDAYNTVLLSSYAKGDASGPSIAICKSTTVTPATALVGSNAYKHTYRTCVLDVCSEINTDSTNTSLFNTVLLVNSKLNNSAYLAGYSVGAVDSNNMYCGAGLVDSQFTGPVSVAIRSTSARDGSLAINKCTKIDDVSFVANNCYDITYGFALNHCSGFSNSFTINNCHNGDASMLLNHCSGSYRSLAINHCHDSSISVLINSATSAHGSICLNDAGNCNCSILANNCRAYSNTLAANNCGRTPYFLKELEGRRELNNGNGGSDASIVLNDCVAIGSHAIAMNGCSSIGSTAVAIGGNIDCVTANSFNVGYNIHNNGGYVNIGCNITNCGNAALSIHGGGTRDFYDPIAKKQQQRNTDAGSVTIKNGLALFSSFAVDNSIASGHSVAMLDSYAIDYSVALNNSSAMKKSFATNSNLFSAHDRGLNGATLKVFRYAYDANPVLAVEILWATNTNTEYAILE